MGVWIETVNNPKLDKKHRKSHPSWVCGLKLYMYVCVCVPYMSHPSWVCGLKHNWRGNYLKQKTSHPSWVCGLKHFVCPYLLPLDSHTLRGCVDWNVKQKSKWKRKQKVTPFVGVWIETFCSLICSKWRLCHTLRGCVDWNLCFK